MPPAQGGNVAGTGHGAATHSKSSQLHLGSTTQGSHTAGDLIIFSIKEGLEDNPPEWHLPCGLLLPGWENCPLFFSNKSEGKPVLSRQHSLGAAEDFAGIAMNNSLSTEFRSK